MSLRSHISAGLISGGQVIIIPQEEAAMGAYTPLHTWLIGQPPYVNNVPATFTQIETILGFTLPATAREKPQWWENNASRHVQAQAWLDAGFQTRDVNIPGETLTFSRNQAN